MNPYIQPESQSSQGLEKLPGQFKGCFSVLEVLGKILNYKYGLFYFLIWSLFETNCKMETLRLKSSHGSGTWEYTKGKCKLLIPLHSVAIGWSHCVPRADIFYRTHQHLPLGHKWWTSCRWFKYSRHIVLSLARGFLVPPLCLTGRRTARTRFLLPSCCALSLTTILLIMVEFAKSSP